jgi:hypothetical protein
MVTRVIILEPDTNEPVISLADVLRARQAWLDDAPEPYADLLDAQTES